MNYSDPSEEVIDGTNEISTVRRNDNVADDNVSITSSQILSRLNKSLLSKDQSSKKSEKVRQSSTNDGDDRVSQFPTKPSSELRKRAREKMLKAKIRSRRESESAKSDDVQLNPQTSSHDYDTTLMPRTSSTFESQKRRSEFALPGPKKAKTIQSMKSVGDRRDTNHKFYSSENDHSNDDFDDDNGGGDGDGDGDDDDDDADLSSGDDDETDDGTDEDADDSDGDDGSEDDSVNSKTSQKSGKRTSDRSKTYKSIPVRKDASFKSSNSGVRNSAAIRASANAKRDLQQKMIDTIEQIRRGPYGSVIPPTLGPSGNPVLSLGSLNYAQLVSEFHRVSQMSESLKYAEFMTSLLLNGTKMSGEAGSLVKKVFGKSLGLEYLHGWDRQLQPSRLAIESAFGQMYTEEGPVIKVSGRTNLAMILATTAIATIQSNKAASKSSDSQNVNSGAHTVQPATQVPYATHAQSSTQDSVTSRMQPQMSTQFSQSQATEQWPTANASNGQRLGNRLDDGVKEPMRVAPLTFSQKPTVSFDSLRTTHGNMAPPLPPAINFENPYLARPSARASSLKIRPIGETGVSENLGNNETSGTIRGEVEMQYNSRPKDKRPKRLSIVPIEDLGPGSGNDDANDGVLGDIDNASTISVSVTGLPILPTHKSNLRDDREKVPFVSPDDSISVISGSSANEFRINAEDIQIS